MTSHYFSCLLLLCIFHTVNFSGANEIQQELTNGIQEPLEYKLTKLLDIHVGKEVNNFPSSLRDTIRSEVRNVLEDLVNELEDTKQNVHLPRQLEIINGLKVGRDSNNFQKLTEFLKEIISEIHWIKKNIYEVTSTFLSTYHDDVQNFINKSPVGVSYDHQIYSSSKHLYPTNLWKNTSYVPKTCKEIQSHGYNVSGIYKIQPVKTEKPFMVLCDMETHGGGWTYIQNRFDGSQDFYLNWREYKFGFGDLEREFWLGLENIYSLTSSVKNELLVEVADKNNSKAYAHYKEFEIGPESDGYQLKVLSGFSGTAGESLSYHIGKKFSTKDFDQDDQSNNCAVVHSGAWWYKSCMRSNLNGKYRNVDLPSKYRYEGLHWDTFVNADYSHSKSRMLVRPVQ